MSKATYTSVPLDEEKADDTNTTQARRSWGTGFIVDDVISVVFLIAFAIMWFVVGLAVGRSETFESWGRSTATATAIADWTAVEQGLLPPQAFIPEIPMKEVVFEFPTKYEDTGIEGDKLWNEMMPLGAGFLNVPNPRQYDMPQSKNGIPGTEIYSLSVTHQLHCLGVLRDVIKKYEKRDKSRFAGDGHEYHCLDYVRQAVLCAGDTTLDFAEMTIGPDGIEHRNGFSGAGSKHQCRDWEAIKTFAIEHRSGNRTGIF